MLKKYIVDYFLALVAVICATKFYFVAHNEILALPYDSEAYMRQATSQLWSLGVPSGYPFWVSISRAFGIPQRMAIELLFLLSSVVFSVSIRGCFGKLASIVVLMFLVFSPATLFLFDQALSDGFFGCLTLLAAAFSVRLMLSRGAVINYIDAALLGLILGWMAITRNEDPIMTAWLLSIVVFLAIVEKNGRQIFSFSVWKKPVFTGLFVTFVVIVFVLGVSLLHYLYSGVFARDVATMPGHTKLLNNLAKIDSGEGRIKRVPISAQSRLLAYQASPTFAYIRSVVEDTANPYQQVSLKSGLPPGEIGAGWIWHVFNNAMFQRHKTHDVRIVEAEYKKINAELDAAFDSGVLKKRFVWHSFIDNSFFGVIFESIIALPDITSKSFEPTNYWDDRDGNKELFNIASLRRASLIGGAGQTHLQGWAYINSAGRKIRAVQVSGVPSEYGKMLYFDRPDVTDGYSVINGWRPEVVGFKSELSSPSIDAINVSYILDDGSVVRGKISASNSVTSLDGVGGVKVIQGIDFVDMSKIERMGGRHRLQEKLIDFLHSANASPVFLFVIFIIPVCCLALAWRLAGGGGVTFYVVLFLSLMWFVRLVFYSAIDSQAWSVEVRYLLAANFLYTAVFGIFISLCTAFWLRMLSLKRF